MPIIHRTVSGSFQSGTRLPFEAATAGVAAAGSNETLNCAGSSSAEAVFAPTVLAACAFARGCLVSATLRAVFSTGVIVALYESETMVVDAGAGATALATGNTFHCGNAPENATIASAHADAAIHTMCRSAADRPCNIVFTVHAANKTTLLFSVAANKLIRTGLA